MSELISAGAIPLQREPSQGECCRRALDERRSREFTIGDWATEKESEDAFDAAVPTDLFKIHRQVWGVLISPRPAQAERRSEKSGKDEIRIRIDRVLVPKAALLDLGWRHGIIGCEIKRSGEKIGPAIAQAMDYSRCVWMLDPDRSRFRIYLDYVFIWPMAKHGSTIGSILAQNRIGSANANSWTRLKLMCGETPILHVEPDPHGSVRIGSGLAGARAGSR